MTIFDQNAAELRRLHEDIKRTFLSRSKSDDARSEWSEACRLFHDSYDGLAFPGGLSRALDLLKQGDSESVEAAIRFLEADPWFHRSGYIKEEIIQRLKHCRLSVPQEECLRQLILKSIKNPHREFRRYRQLARRVDSDAFRRKLKDIMDTTEDKRIQQLAGWTILVLDNKEAQPRRPADRKLRGR